MTIGRPICSVLCCASNSIEARFRARSEEALLTRDCLTREPCEPASRAAFAVSESEATPHLSPNSTNASQNDLRDACAALRGHYYVPG